ncbi:MAG: hypothetical protein AAF959_01155, partial [Cyanobacteria bacterium P01_D01_bin.56]
LPVAAFFIPAAIPTRTKLLPGQSGTQLSTRDAFLVNPPWHSSLEIERWLNCLKFKAYRSLPQ